MENLFNSLFGVHCVLCGHIGKMLCYSCSYKINIFERTLCAVCNELSFNGKTHTECFERYPISSIFSCFVFDTYTQKIIINAKKAPHEFGAFEELVRYGLQYVVQAGIYMFDCKVKLIPYSKNAIREMGYNPSLLIYKELHQKFGLNMIENPPYTEKILLVNDVFEKDDYSLEFSKHLYANGAKDIRIFTICRML